MLTKAPKGTKDILPEASAQWHRIEDIMRDICARYGFMEARTPVFEHTELFLRSVGDTTDIVQKEMYTFEDKGGRSVTLKPEGTAGVVRMFVEHGLFNLAQPTKMYYLNTPVFRYENPQAGRLREHHQFGIELFGAKSATCDAEIISLAMDVLKSAGVEGLALNINSIGCMECRPGYNTKLKAYFAENENRLCNMCKNRLQTNPLRILDCKDEGCADIIADAPLILDSICGECAGHFDLLQSCLQSIGMDFRINPKIVRGLDYYTKTVFEIISTEIGSQGTVCGGGRYDGLVAEVGGPDMPGVGFGMGMERLLMVLQSQNKAITPLNAYDIYICSMDEEGAKQAFRLAKALRDAGVSAELNHGGKSMKAQFKYADKLGVSYVAIMGQDELEKGIIKLKDMKGGPEDELPIGTAVEAILKMLGKDKRFDDIEGV